MRISVLIFVFFVSCFSADCSVNDLMEFDSLRLERDSISEEERVLAVESALLWLEEIDSGDYDKAWQSSSSIIKSVVLKDEFFSSIKPVRDYLGKIIERKLKKSLYKEELPGAPDGRYLIIHFDVVFENKKNGVETITPKYEAGEWKVSGYYIK